jgi:hypothetical protein
MSIIIIENNCGGFKAGSAEAVDCKSKQCSINKLSFPKKIAGSGVFKLQKSGNI